MEISLLKTDGKYYLYKKVMNGLKPNADGSEFTEIKFIMNELYLGSIYSGVSVGYVADVDNFETAVSAHEEELSHLAKEFSKEELRDLLSAVEFDTQGSHGDERAKRLDKLESKIRREISKLS